MKNLFRSTRPIILASGSPRRIDFLTGLGIDFQVFPAISPEPECGPEEHPHDFTIRSATFKAREIFSKIDDRLKREMAVVIGADTVVALGKEIMGKPRDKADALAMLQSLAGQGHAVYTGCSCIFAQGECAKNESLELCFYSKSQVWMHDFSDQILSAYVNTGEPMDKAGAYAIQGTGAFLVKAVEGSWTNIVGLPLDKLVQVLLENGAIAPKINTSAEG